MIRNMRRAGRAMRAIARNLTGCATSLCAAAVVLAAVPANGAELLADTPLFLTVSVPPNITLTLDDSGSMSRGWVPENCTGTGTIRDCEDLDNRHEKSAKRNLIFYNPAVTYPAPRNADGTFRTTSFFAAYRNGFDAASGTVNLSRNYRPTASLQLHAGRTEEWYMGHYPDDVRCAPSGRRMCQINDGTRWFNTMASCNVSNRAGERDAFCRGLEDSDYDPAPVPAYYYVFNEDNADCNGTATDNDCYTIKLVSRTSGPGGTDERQNFANWYSFARTRNLATVTAASLAFADVEPTVRVAWQALNSCRGSSTDLLTANCQGWKRNFSAMSNSIAPFADAQKRDFYSWLAQLPTNDGTPLPDAMARAGEYYKTSGNGSPYDNNIGRPGGGEYACRRNYHIMMTDGMWNNAVTAGSQDGSSHSLPERPTDPDATVSSYTPRPPYEDRFSNTLADVAFDYWITDLRPSLPNILAPIYNDNAGTANQRYWNPRNDPASWQHMVNYTIGLGLSSYLTQASPSLTWGGSTYTGSYPALASGDLAWPRAFSDDDNPGNVSDLWHAAINSRGQFFSADDPASLSAAFQSVLTAIAGNSGSAAALSANSTYVQPDSTVIFQARFNRDWSGALVARAIMPDGSIGSPLWDASERIPVHSARRIFTFDGRQGVPFASCANLNVSQVYALSTGANGVYDGLCADRLQWLRGNPQREIRNTGGIFRNRPATVMGDVVNSDPAYVKDFDYGYAGLPSGTPGQASYASFRSANATRMPMIYVGSNDGRLYGIRADTGNERSGVEQFSYVPAGVYQNLRYLMEPVYAHRYFVDGSATVGDAFLGSDWETVLVAGLGGGGRSVFALNVTRPDAFDTTNVMWEFTDPDMGLSFSQPQIGILQNGQWVAVFGNGYNSPVRGMAAPGDGGGAYLYVVDLATGALLRKIRARDDAGDDNNGLSTPLLYDSDGDRLIDAVYAGDLQGNLWKFDLSDGSAGSWNAAYGASPLFTARGPAGELQRITSQPNAGGHPLGGTMVVFGTGRYLTAADVFDQTVQTYYGIRDNGSAVPEVDRSSLQVQAIRLQDNGFGREVRTVTGNIPDWNVKQGWYVDLVDPPMPPGTAQGERVVSAALIRFGRVIFVTTIPSSDPCSPGGTSWLMELDLVTGGTFAESILDLNNDNAFDDRDTIRGEVISGVRTAALGISKTPLWLEDDAKAFKLMTGTGGGFVSEKNRKPTPPPEEGSVIRRSWIQIR